MSAHDPQANYRNALDQMVKAVETVIGLSGEDPEFMSKKEQAALERASEKLAAEIAAAKLILGR